MFCRCRQKQVLSPLNLFAKRFICKAFLLLALSSKALSQINGISVEGPPKAVGPGAFADIKTSAEANFVSLHPYAYTDGTGPELLWENLGWQWRGEGMQGTRESLRMAKEAGMSVMIKPHIWLHNGDYTGKFNLNNDSDWEVFENGYRNYILAYARMAQQEKSDMFCVGNELGAFIKARPEFWKNLIAEVRKVYSGPVTYAGNWDDFADCPFWRSLDYIGINAYFPLSAQQTPDLKTLLKAWKNKASLLQKISKVSGRSIMFTEYGYRSADHCCRAPWDSAVESPANEQAQSNALQALYSALWGKPWFAGGFLWKWHLTEPRHPGRQATQYAVQGKKALQTVRSAYTRP